MVGSANRNGGETSIAPEYLLVDYIGINCERRKEKEYNRVIYSVSEIDRYILETFGAKEADGSNSKDAVMRRLSFI